MLAPNGLVKIVTHPSEYVRNAGPKGCGVWSRYKPYKYRVFVPREGSSSDILTDVKQLAVVGEGYAVTTTHSSLTERIVGSEVCLLRANKVVSEWKSISRKQGDRDAKPTCRHSRTTPSSRANFLKIGSSSTSNSSVRKVRLA